MKHVFSVAGAALAVLALTSHWFADGRLTHGKEYLAAAVTVVVFHVAGALAARALKPKPPATPARPVYPFSGSGTRR